MTQNKKPQAMDAIKHFGCRYVSIIFMAKPFILLFFMCLAKLCTSQADSLHTSNTSLYIGLDYGLPIYNSMNISYGHDDANTQWVHARSAGVYGLNFAIGHKHMRYILGVNNFTSEFRGRDFTVQFAGYKYYMYQDVKYNVLSINLGIGYTIDLSTRQKLNVSLLAGIPASGDFRINNYYSKVAQPNDSTLFKPSKNCIVPDASYGRIPRFNLNVSYEYYIWKQVALNANINFLYAYYYGGNMPEKEAAGGTLNGTTGSYCFLAYNAHRQVAIVASLGLKFKFP